MIEINEQAASALMLGEADRGDEPPARRRAMETKRMWLIPTFYAAASIAAGLVVPRLQSRFLASGLDLSTSSAQAYLSAVASGMMAYLQITRVLQSLGDSGREAIASTYQEVQWSTMSTGSAGLMRMGLRAPGVAAAACTGLTPASLACRLQRAGGEGRS